MASTYSQYKIELIGTGEQAGLWGGTTNNNFGSSTPGVYQGFEQAIGGKADINMNSTTITLTLTNTNAAQDARALYLNLTGTPGGAAVLEVPAIQKGYLVKNGSDQVVTVKVTGQTGVAVPVGATMWLYNNGTDVTNAITNLPSGATVGGVAIGTGSGTVTSVDVSGGTTGLTTSGGPVTGSGTITIAGTLGVANGGTGATSLTSNNVILGNGTSAVQFVAPSTSGNVLTSNGTTWQSTAPAVALGTAQTFTAAQTFRAADAIRSEAASTQDAIVIAGRAGGSNSRAITLTPAELSANRTLTLPDPGSNETLGYLNIPQNSQSAAYTLVATDAGKHILHPSADTTARTFTIPANSSVPFPIGTAITFINQNGAGVVTIAITTDTMRLAGAGTTGSRTLAANGIATCVKITSTEWIISGTGLT